jgi:cobalamin biosynthesis protein CbiG
MDYCVVYFTRTYVSKRVAQKIAEKLSCPMVQITDHKNWSGLFGYIKAGFYSTINKEVKIELLGDPGQPDAYIVVTPLWAGGIAPAGKAFLKTVSPDKVHLVVTSLGSQVEEREGFLSVSDVIDQQNNEDQVISDLLKRIK